MREVPRIEGQPRRALEQTGAALLPAAEGAEEAARRASDTPWAFAERLFGERVLLVERQPIRPVPGGRTFASSGAFTPLHTDSQTHLGVPASVQVLVCRRPAATGGESTLLDAWALLGAVAASDPALHARIFDEARHIPFYFGDFAGRTVSLRRGHVFFTHSPVVREGDPLAALLRPHLERAPRAVLRVEAGDVLVVNNHRVLHGRLPFDDPGRELVRLLVWLERPFAAPPELARRAHPEAAPEDPAAGRRVAVVLEMLRGVPPGVLAAREGIAEAELYRWREEALLGAAEKLRTC